MVCRHVKSQLNRYLDNELTAAERRRIEQHLGECAGCREALAGLRMVTAVLAKAPVPPDVPNGFAGRVMAQACRRPPPTPVIRRLWQSFPPLMRFAAAAVLVLGLALGILMARSLSGDAPGAARPAPAIPNDVYGLDYLSEAPGGSLADTYMTLASAGN